MGFKRLKTVRPVSASHDFNKTSLNFKGLKKDSKFGVKKMNNLNDPGSESTGEMFDRLLLDSKDNE